ncbi:MAG TPA: hypothetical protein VKP65_09350 [Rhodothermales bacterium]|nr:hypothetical protein [Rhodothermales bacterium]
MTTNNTQVLLANRFAFRNPTLLLARARLHSDRIVLSGWHLRGRYTRVIPLDRVLQIDVLDDEGLLLWLASGETIRLRINQAHVWKRVIEAKQVDLS